MNFFKILLVIVLFPTIVEAQKDTIFWQENTKLKFEDFKKVPLIGKIRAISHFEYPCKYKWKQDTMYLTTKLCFIKSLSFFNKDSLSIRKVKVLEKHEQGHFDIAEIEMRKLRVKFKQAKLNNQNISSIFTSLTYATFLSTISKDSCMLNPPC